MQMRVYLALVSAAAATSKLSRLPDVDMKTTVQATPLLGLQHEGDP